MAEGSSIAAVFRAGTTTANNAYVGANGEITTDVTKGTVRVHDGTTPGGTELARMSDLTGLGIDPQNFSISGDGTAPAVAFDGTAPVNLVLTFSNSGVGAGTYGSASTIPTFTVDAKGRITSANSVALSWSNLGSVPANLTNLLALSTSGFVKKTGADTWAIDTATYLTSVTLTGDVTGSGGSSFATTLANTAVTPGSYGNGGQIPTFTVDAKGRLTAASATALTFANIASKPTTLAGYGITDAAPLVGGLIPSEYLPAVAITDTSVVANQAAMLALTAQKGDVAVRSDESKTYILAAEPASTLGNWVQLPTPTDAVLSVNGQTGVVVLDFATSSHDHTSITGSAAKWTTPRQIALTGGVTGSVNIDGSANVEIAAVVTQDSTHRFVSDAQISTWNAANVSSVGLALPAFFTVSNSPVTGGGTLTAVMASQTANKFLGSPSGAPGAPDFRVIENADLPVSGATAATYGGAAKTLTATVNDRGIITSISQHDLLLDNLGNADDLKAIEALAGTSGLLKKTAANTWSLDTATYLTANQSITLSGDVSGSGTTSITVTLANSGVTAATYGSATEVPVITVDAKGRITSATTAAVSGGGGDSIPVGALIPVANLDPTDIPTGYEFAGYGLSGSRDFMFPFMTWDIKNAVVGSGNIVYSFTPFGFRIAFDPSTETFSIPSGQTQQVFVPGSQSSSTYNQIIKMFKKSNGDFIAMSEVGAWTVNSSTFAWTYLDKWPASVSSLTQTYITMLSDDKILLANTTTTRLFDPATGTYSNPTNLSVAARVCSLADGGAIALTNSTETKRWNAARTTWSVVGNHGFGSSDTMMLRLADGTVFALQMSATTCQIFNPATDTWTSKASAPGSLNNTPALFEYSGYVYVYQGGSSTYSIYRYNISANTWSTISAIQPSYVQSSTVVIVEGGGRLFAISDNCSMLSWSTNSDFTEWTGIPLTSTISGYANGAYIGNNKFMYGINLSWKICNTSTGSITTATSPPASVAANNLVWNGSDYVYGLSSSGTMYRYSISGDSWATLASCPDTAVSKMVKLDSDRILCGDSSNRYGTIYKISTNAFTVARLTLGDIGAAEPCNAGPICVIFGADPDAVAVDQALKVHRFDQQLGSGSGFGTNTAPRTAGRYNMIKRTINSVDHYYMINGSNAFYRARIFNLSKYLRKI